jgi:carboxypeptidase PM20D1
MATAATALLFVGIVILVVNAGRLRSRQIPLPAAARVSLDEKEPGQRLSRAIQFRTVSHEDPARIDPQPFLALHEFLEEAFPLTHRTLRREVVGELSLLYTWEGTDLTRQPFLLMSHIDVVPVETGSEAKWPCPPFAGEVADGYVWGRGALDDKCGALGILEAVELLIAEGFRPACTVYLALGHDEEVGGRNGNAQIAALLQDRGVHLRYVLDEGGLITQDIIKAVSQPVALVGVAEKGQFSIELTASGPGGHCSMPPAQSAIGTLGAALRKLERRPMAARIDGATELLLEFLGPEMPFWRRMMLANRWLFGGLVKRQFAKERAGNAAIRTTAAVTAIHSGVSGNVLPQRATATVSFRLLPGDSPADVLRHVAQTIKDKHVTWHELGSAPMPSRVSDTASADFEILHRSIREVFPELIVAPGLTTVRTDSRHYETIADNTYRFIPARITPDDLEKIHGSGERIPLENYLEIIRFFIQQIRNSAS